MTLKERLMADMKEAMKAKEAGKVKLSVIRMARAAIKNTEIEKGKELSDQEVIEVLAREVKQRRDAIVEYRKAEREDVVKDLEAEIEVLLGYLPQQLTHDEIKALVQEAIREVGATGPKEMGKVMGVLMPRVKGRADGKLVNEIVRQELGG